MAIRAEGEREAIAKRVREIRSRHGLSRAKLHELIGVPPRTMQSWEEMTTTPAPYIVDWMEHMLECDKHSGLFTEDEKQELVQAIDGRIEEYESIVPKTPKQQEEIDASISSLKSALDKIR